MQQHLHSEIKERCFESVLGQDRFALLAGPADDCLWFAEPALLVHQQGSVTVSDLEDREY